MSDAVIFVSVMEPFSGAPVTRIARAGMSCTEIVELCYSTQALAREWDDALVLYLGDRPLPREWWSKAKPKPGVLVALRPRPRWQTIGSWIYNAVQWMGQSGFAQSLLSAAISYGISALTAADPDSMAFDPRFSIDGARNDARPYASWPAVLGTHRVFPPQAAKAWTSTNGDKVWLHLLLGLGLAPIKLDPDSIQIGDTPLSNFSGASWGVREKPGDAIPSPWASISPDEQEGPGLVNQSDGWVTRTTDATDAERLQVELSWLEGLLRITSSGKHDAITVEYRLRYRKVGDEDWLSFATGAPSSTGALYSQHRATLQPFRVVHTRDGVDAGQYEIGFQRVTPDYDNPNIRTRIGWAKLRTFANAPPVIDDNLALLSVTVEAGPQLNNVVDRINCVISRVAPLWDSEEEDWETAEPDETSNPAALVRWIATGPGMAKPYGADGVDEAAFGAWFEKCVGMDWRCDMDVPTGASASPEDVMQMVARCGRATISRRGGKLVPILDSDQPHATQLFTPRNSWGLRARRVLPPETQAYRVQFNNADKNFVLDEMVVYFPGFNAGNITLAPELITVPGKTRAVEVNREAKRRIAEVLLRGMEYTFSADWENFASQRGQRVAFAHWDVAVGRISGRVKAIELNEAETNVVAIVLDEYATQTIGEDYAISWRRVDAADENPAPGMEVESLGVATTPGTSNRIELAAVGGVPIASAPKVGDLVTFGDAGIQTLDLVLGNLRRMSHYEAELSAAAYVDALYDDDDAPEPEWYSNVSGDAFPQPPAPQIMGAVASDVGMFVDFDFPANTAARVIGIETYWRPTSDEDARFEPVGVLGPGARLAAFPPGSRGETYELLIVAVGQFGRAQSTTELVSLNPVASRFFGRLTQYAVTVPANSAGVVSSFANAGGVFEIFDGETEITTTANITFSVESETGVDVSIDAETGEYSVNSMSADTGVAVFKAVIDGDEDATLRAGYSISKAIAGAPGLDGDPGSPGSPGAPGSDGLSVAELVIYRRASSAPATPTGGSYNFGTQSLTPPTDWSSAIPSGNAPVYASRAVAAVQGVSGTDSTLTWSAPVMITQEGSAVDIIFTRNASQPSTPSASSGVPSGWSSSVGSAPGTGPLWSSVGTRPNAGANWTWQAAVRVEGIDGSPGAPGAPGADSTSYWLLSSAAALSYNGSAYTPSTVTFSAKSKTGAGAPANYSGRFIIAESTNGVDFTDVYTSGSNEASRVHTPGANVQIIRCRLYLAGGTSTLLDETSLPVTLNIPPGAVGGVKTVLQDDNTTTGATPIDAARVALPAVAAGGRYRISVRGLAQVAETALTSGEVFNGAWNVVETSNGGASSAGEVIVSGGGGSFTVTHDPPFLYDVLFSNATNRDGDVHTAGARDLVLRVWRTSGSNDVQNFTAVLTVEYIPPIS